MQKASQSLIKTVRSLHQKKYRREANLIFVEGIKLCSEVMAAGYAEYVLCTEKGLSKLTQLHPAFRQYYLVSEKEMERLSLLSTPSEAIAVCPIPENSCSVADLQPQFLLALDNISDPGNLGTIIRTADWFGIRHILCSDNTVEFHNPKVLQATMGSFLRVELHYGNLSEMLAIVKKSIPVAASVMNGISIYETPFNRNVCLVIGNEAHGISEDVRKIADYSVSIPLPYKATTQHPESLNASIAAAIMMSEIARRG